LKTQRGVSGKFPDTPRFFGNLIDRQNPAAPFEQRKAPENREALNEIVHKTSFFKKGFF